MTKYPVLTLRLKKTTKIRLKKLSLPYKTWDIFINELINKYEKNI
jgi:hypothetical protein